MLRPQMLCRVFNDLRIMHALGKDCEQTRVLESKDFGTLEVEISSYLDVDNDRVSSVIFKKENEELVAQMIMIDENTAVWFYGSEMEWGGKFVFENKPHSFGRRRYRKTA